jgi:hypothetical protein
MPLARWNGPFDALLSNQSAMKIGDTMEVSERDLESAHWERVKNSPATAEDAKSKTKGDDS